MLILAVVASKATAGGPYDSPGKDDCGYKHPNLVDSDEVKQNVACMPRNNIELLRNKFCKQNSNCDTILLEITDIQNVIGIIVKTLHTYHVSLIVDSMLCI